jgi:hypothetical protein
MLFYKGFDESNPLYLFSILFDNNRRDAYATFEEEITSVASLPRDDRKYFTPTLILPLRRGREETKMDSHFQGCVINNYILQ